MTLIALKLAMVLVLSSFMALSAVSFFRFRLKKKERDFERIMQVVGLDEGAAAAAFSPTIENEYSAADYYLPVGFATIVCLAGFGFAVFARELVTQHPGEQNLLLTGIYARTPDVLQAMRWQSAFVLALAFLGGFIWSAQSIIRRLITADLNPGTFYGAGVRMIFASLIALVLSWLLQDSPWRDRTLPAIAFLTGMLPEQALLYVQEKSRIFANRGVKRSHDLPLTMIEGINTFHTVRLGEVAVDNSQNLAEANVIELLLRTPFPANQLIDWIAQAKLYVFVKDDLEKLRTAGVRNAFDFVAVGEERLGELVDKTSLSLVQLRIVHERLRSDPALPALWRFRALLTGFARDGRGAGAMADTAFEMRHGARAS